ncbi:MPN527 family putative ECF transporter permease subunit [Mycoplasmopsis opalescens]|uniref:MPN527 family putative ECF transporter permease subunit n=1 Tax=Mycoplasmopsis opalescens TaxID=114886 RepID=UPI0004A74952|nr:hypothetical protein [Mycoplasmopsis opalescens]
MTEFSAQSKTNSIYWKKPLIRQITLTAFFLALMLILGSFGSLLKFFPGSFLSYDITIALVIFAFRIIGFRYTFLIILLGFLIGPFFSSNGYNALTIVGHFALSLSHMSMLLAYSLLFFVIRSNLKNTINKLKKEILLNAIILPIASLITTFIMIGANMISITPLYFYLFGLSKSIMISDAIDAYDKLKILFFNINNYYTGLFSLYGLFNVANLTINCILISIILTINAKSNFSRNYYDINKD